MISDEYRWTLLVVLIIIFQYFVSLIIGGSPRRSIFTQEWMDKNFGKEHEAAFKGKDQIGKGGYPDHGNGRYAAKLDYASWMKFALAQRVHYNFLENIMQVSTGLLMCGLYDSKIATYIGVVYLLGRTIFTIGYQISPKARFYGLPFMMLPQMLLPIYTIYCLN